MIHWMQKNQLHQKTCVILGNTGMPGHTDKMIGSI